MTSGINMLGMNNVEQTIFQPQISQRQDTITQKTDSLISFEDEDQAIISSQAKLLNELDKFNSGDDNLVNLAFANVNAKIMAQVEVNVINTQKDMFDAILNIGKND